MVVSGSSRLGNGTTLVTACVVDESGSCATEVDYRINEDWMSLKDVVAERIDKARNEAIRRKPR